MARKFRRQAQAISLRHTPSGRSMMVCSPARQVQAHGRSEKCRPNSATRITGTLLNSRRSFSISSATKASVTFREPRTNKTADKVEFFPAWRFHSSIEPNACTVKDGSVADSPRAKHSRDNARGSIISSVCCPKLSPKFSATAAILPIGSMSVLAVDRDTPGTEYHHGFPFCCDRLLLTPHLHCIIVACR